MIHKSNRGGWKTCTRGHKYRGSGACPVCWPAGARKKAAGRRDAALRSQGDPR